ncbi:MAG: hypothetical protein AAGF95_29700 [Chloroflexota bacterium]
MNEVLTQVIINTILFLELSDDEIIDQDAAVSQLEQMASILKQLDEADQKTFIKLIEKFADEEDSTDQERIQFLHSIPENLGLRE